MFYVYGVSLSIAETAARKQQSKFGGSGKNRRELTPGEHEEKVKKLTKLNFKRMKPQRLSHSLATPTFCRQYIQLAKQQEDCRDLQIRYRKPTKKVNPKTKKEVMVWATYLE